jgi:4,5-DOPA dioxygenase extradiol
MPQLMPALFIGHGNPMNAITENPYRTAWRELGAQLPRPQAILCVSAHWQTATPEACGVERPRTIHDFGGFPPDLFAQQYAAPGAPELAEGVRQLLGESVLRVSTNWGLDHGAWCILQSLFPNADVPVCQLSLAHSLDPSGHLALARQLAPLRERGIMLIGSGNVVHNLRHLGQSVVPEWARNFDDYVAQALDAGDDRALVEYAQRGPGAAMAVPSDEHYLPLLYFAGVRHQQDALHTSVRGFDLGSLSMRSSLFSG